MSSVVVSEFGGPDVLRLMDTDKPEPAAGQVRIRVAASAVHPVDLFVRSGGAAGMLDGGDWKFFAVTWNVEPYLLTSADAVLAAAEAGDVTVTRVAENDFKCPVQP